MMTNRNDYFSAVLPNGIRLLHRQQKSAVAHVALMVNTGSRDESAHENGLAHLVEHMIFKGTEHRRAYHVLSYLENVGGDMNAFTTKEETCIHASFLATHYKRCFDLFSDIAFHSSFPTNELEKEKEVVLDEINSYRDTPSEEIFDDFENLLFRGHALGRNILGTEDGIKKISRKDLFRFVKNNYATDQMVLASIGDLTNKQFLKYAQNYFGGFERHASRSIRKPFERQAATTELVDKNSHLSHCIIGNVAFEYAHPQKLPLILLNNVLGGPGMNSRLNLNIREKHGFAYSIESQYTAYSDTGAFAVYVGTDPESLDKVRKMIVKEMDKLREKKLGTLQLFHAKQQLIGQLALSYESGLSELLSVTRAHLLNGRINTMSEIAEKVNRLTAEQLQDVAAIIFNKNDLSTLIFNGNSEEKK